MIEVVFDILKEILKVEFFRRCIVILLLPNILVWGFAEVGIDNKYNFLWSFFINPYWELECFLFKIIFYGFSAAAIYSLLALLMRSWRELGEDAPAQNTSIPEYQCKDITFTEPVPNDPQQAIPLAKTEQVVNPVPRPLTPEEIKRRALRDITGKGA